MTVLVVIYGMLQNKWRLYCVGEADMIRQQPFRTNFDVLLAREAGHETDAQMEDCGRNITMHLGDGR